MNTIKRKINLLTKTFWTYKDIAEFYEISYKTAIKEKKEALLQLQKESDDIEGITKYNWFGNPFLDNFYMEYCNL